MLLKGKTAVIYGAGGQIGGTVAHAFAREGATVFLGSSRYNRPVQSDAVRDVQVLDGGCMMKLYGEGSRSTGCSQLYH